MREGFFYFSNYRNIAKNLPDEIRLKFYDALNDYMFDGKESDDNIVSALITAIKPSLDKIERRGGNHNPFGRKGKIEENQKESKIIKTESNNNQNNQSFNKQETRNKKQENNITISEDIVVKINNILDEFGLAKIKKLTDERKTKLIQRCNDVGGIDEFLKQLKDSLMESSFLRGDNQNGWQADFDFFLQKSSWQKVIEGRYRDKKQAAKGMFGVESGTYGKDIPL